MRIVVQNAAEFVEALDADMARGGTVHLNALRRSKSVNPVEGNSNTILKHEIILQVSAVVVMPEGGEYLLEFGQSCGLDYQDANPDGDEGSKRYEKEFQLIVDLANRRGLHILPGVIHI